MHSFSNDDDPRSLVDLLIAESSARWPSLEDYRRSADSFRFEVDSHLDAVGNFDKRGSSIHPVVLTVEGHCPFDRETRWILRGIEQLISCPRVCDFRIALSMSYEIYLSEQLGSSGLRGIRGRGGDGLASHFSRGTMTLPLG